MSRSIVEGEGLHERVLAWLRSNDINPNDIPSSVHPSLVGDQLTTEVFMRSEQGRVQTAPDGGVAKGTKTFTIAVPPPPDVAEWLRPRCSECGR